MITADQLVLHVVGDYLLQSDWMAVNKAKRVHVALIHASFYCLPFLLLKPSPAALAVMLLSHAAIDHWRLGRYLVWAKNWLGPNKPWSQCSETGYASSHPLWLSSWLLTISDNAIHVIINGLALAYLA